jgi:hypothetical protein
MKREELIQFIWGWIRKKLEEKTDIELHGLAIALGRTEELKIDDLRSKIVG